MVVTKYSASGNDFIIFHTFRKKDRSELAKKLCHRQEGIGADGLIVLLPSDEVDFEWQFYNSDGSVASMCGNGSRATAHYAFQNNLADKKMSFLTGAGVISCKVEGDIVETELTKPKILKTFNEEGYEWKLIDTGVPHLVALVDDLKKFDKSLAQKMRQKYDANVNFAKVENDGTLRVRTYERGVEDETLACGTGMCASFLNARQKNLVGDCVKVYPKSGEELQVRLELGTLFFKGKVQKLFEVVLNFNERDI